MSLLDRLEKALGQLAEGGAEVVFGGRLDLVAVGQELFNVAARESRLRDSGAEAPNEYTILLSLDDYGELAGEVERLQAQYRSSLWARLREAGYLLESVPGVLVTSSETIAAGGFRVEHAFADKRAAFRLTELAEGGKAYRVAAPAVIGRDADCDVPLDSRSASRRHAQVLWSRNHFQLIDLDSKNGTRLNGIPAANSHMEPGDLVEFGELQMQFDLDTDPQ
ncbi:MAG TPA: FhaA domain-containing protein [Armatimonadota bacterium]|nr:FhaA domain-containing protein [Armatimonadota bacterium]